MKKRILIVTMVISTFLIFFSGYVCAASGVASI